jgi:hypothetical protein
MAEAMTATDLDADLVERTAKTIGRARLLTEYSHDPVTISVDGYDLYFRNAHASYRLALRQQAIAVLRGSELLERVAELERKVAAAKADLECYGADPEGDRLARQDALGHLSKIKNLPEIGAVRPDGFKSGPCPYTNAHTRHWCGCRDCRDA